MTPQRDENGEWVVASGGKVIAGPFERNADAWRWIDRRLGEPINQSEKIGDWISQKILNGE